MTIWTNQSGSFSSEVDDPQEFDRFERISHRQHNECPVRSHASRTRARMRSRGGPGARRKGRSINGAHRRGRHVYHSPAF
jgi:hypothetical protein